MSYVNVSPEVTFTKLDRVIRSQRRLMFYDLGVVAVFASGLLASLASFM
jgi:hypothetical protein